MTVQQNSGQEYQTKLFEDAGTSWYNTARAASLISPHVPWVSGRNGVSVLASFWRRALYSMVSFAQTRLSCIALVTLSWLSHEAAFVPLFLLETCSGFRGARTGEISRIHPLARRRYIMDMLISFQAALLFCAWGNNCAVHVHRVKQVYNFVCTCSCRSMTRSGFKCG